MFARILIRMSSSLPHHVIWETEELVAYLHPSPWTPGTVTLERKPLPGGDEAGGPGRGSIFHLAEREYLSLMLGARSLGRLLGDRLGVRRCALVSKPHRDSPAQIRLLPLHGLGSEWRPHLAEEERFSPHDPGYITSLGGPLRPPAHLLELQAQIRARLPAPDAPPDLTFLGEDPRHAGLFSRIVRGEEQQWRVWEDRGHVAFLTPFPNSPGLTVIVPRRPLTSDILRLEEGDYTELVLATRKVSLLLEEGLGAWGVGLIFEGFEIDYAHAKLIPLIAPPAGEEAGPIASLPPPRFYPVYPGYVSSEDGPEASSESLKELQVRITQA
ncbi:uncharacterized protein LOC134024095 isoform X2 [Osmerus eperlanus]|uniref:uncharacterized protein LOC134024095 isoform X2 n=1 Tax=Osmerus eperlanus TaxID=29151 RepID=UPI002E128C48